MTESRTPRATAQTIANLARREYGAPELSMVAEWLNTVDPESVDVLALCEAAEAMHSALTNLCAWTEGRLETSLSRGDFADARAALAQYEGTEPE